MNWIDYGIIAVIIVGGIIGYTRGLILSLFTFLSYFLAILGAKIFSPKLVGFLSQSTTIASKIEAFIVTRLNAINIPGFNGSISQLRIPQNFDQAIINDPALKKVFAQNPMLMNAVKQNPVMAAGQTIAGVMVTAILSIICIVIIFIVIKIILNILGKVIDKSIEDVSVLKTSNKIAGFVLGGLAGMVIAFLVLVIISPFAYSFNISGLSQAMRTSMIVGFLSSTELFVSFLNFKFF